MYIWSQGETIANDDRRPRQWNGGNKQSMDVWNDIQVAHDNDK